MIPQTEGAPQGFGPTPALAAATIEPTIKEVREAYPTLAVSQVCDDTGFAGSPQEVLQAAVKTIEGLKDAIGVQVNPVTLYAPNGLSEDLRGQFEALGFRVTESGLTFAGTPIGTPEYKDAWVEEKADEVLGLFELARELHNLDAKGDALQGIFRWLRLSVLPKFNHVLQAVEPSITIPHAIRIDKAAVKLALDLARGAEAFGRMNPDEQDRVSFTTHLPVKLGGLGLASQEQAAYAAYAGKVAAVLSRAVTTKSKGGLDIEQPPVVDDVQQAYPEWTKPYEETLAKVRELLGEVGALPKCLTLDKIWTDPVRGAQSTISSLMSGAVKAFIDEEIKRLPDIPGREVATQRHMAQDDSGSGAWLTAKPGDPMSRMSNPTFQHALRFRLLLPLGIEEGAKCAQCAKPLDPYGNHAMLCTHMRGHRCAAARLQQELLRQCASKHGIHPFPGEPRVEDYLAPRPGGKDEPLPARRFDVALPSNGTVDGQHLLVDLVITATTKSGKAYKAAGTAAIAAEHGKQQFYKRSYMNRPGGPQHDIAAFGQETDGPLGLQARGILRTLAERPAYWTPYGQNNFGQRYRTLVEYFSVFLQKWRAMVEVRFLRSCVDPNAPQEPLDADAQAEVDGGEGGGEVPLDEEDDDGSVAGSLPSGSPPKGSPPPSQASQPGSGGSQGAE